MDVLLLSKLTFLFLVLHQGIILSELRFSQLGGLQLEREIRRLTLHLSSAFPHASVKEHHLNLRWVFYFTFLLFSSRSVKALHASHKWQPF